MKYKIGDRIVIKQNRMHNIFATEQLEKVDYIVTIKSIEEVTFGKGFCYRVKENDYNWHEDNIEHLAKKLEKITSRFDILDI